MVGGKVLHIYREDNTIGDFLESEAVQRLEDKLLDNMDITGRLKGMVEIDRLELPSFHFK